MELRSITVETLAAFAQALRAEERCTETIKQYTRSVRQFAAWLAPETVRGGPFASREPNLLRKVGEDRFLPDDFSHEQSMVLETGRGLVVLNSCCHGGVVNIVQGVLDQFPGQRAYALLGGLHMLSPGPNALNCTPDYVRQVAAALLELGVEHLWTGHCTGPAAFALLKEELGDRVEPLTGGMRLGI